jgi:uncharacterized membrane protein
MSHLTNSVRPRSGLTRRAAVLFAALASLVIGPFAGSVSAQIYDLSSGEVTINEDTSGSVSLKVAAWGVYTRVNVSSDNQSLLPNANFAVTKTGEFYQFPSSRATFTIVFRPVANGVGKAVISIDANDGAAVHSRASVTVNVSQVDDLPQIAGLSTSVVLNEDTGIVLPFTVSDLEDASGNSISVSASSSQEGLLPNASSFLRVQGSGNQRSLVINPAPNQSGFGQVTVSATQAGQTSQFVFQLVVLAINDPPTLAVSGGNNLTMTEDVPRDVAVSIADVDHPLNQVVFTVVSSSNPSLLPLASIGVTGVGDSRTLRLVPTPHNSGVSTVQFRVADPIGAVSTVNLTVTVTSANDAPVAGNPWAMAFDGNSGMVTTAPVDLRTGSFTVEFWAKDAGLDQERWLLTHGQQPPLPGQQLHIGFRSNNRFAFAFWGDDLDTPIGYTDSEWHHWACVYDRSVPRRTIYRDGAPLVSDTPSGDYSGLGPIAFGFSAATQRYFAGQLDEVRLWSTARTEAQIRSNMNGPIAGTTTGLLGYWQFDEGQNFVGQSSVVVDSTPARLNGVKQGGALYVQRRDDTGLVFDGGVAVVRELGIGAIAPTTEVTVEFWQRADRVGAYSSFIMSPDILPNRFQAHVPYQDGTVYWDFGNVLTLPPQQGRLTYTPPDSLVGKWDHWAFVASQSGNYMRILRNGIVVAQKDGMVPFTRTAQFMDVGRMAGGMDDFRIWSVARTPEQVQAGMNARFTGSEPGLVMYLPMDDAPGATIRDRAPGGRLATVTGATFGVSEPVASFGLRVVNEDVTTPIYLPGYDVEFFRNEFTGLLANIIVTPPAHGTLNFSNGDWANPTRNPFQYTPTGGYNGPDSFTYRLVDAQSGASPVVTVNMVVQEINDAPVIAPIADLTVLENTSTGPISVFVTDDDHPASVLKLTVTLDPPNTSIVPPDAAHVILGGSGNERTLTLIPAEGQVGTVTVTVTADDPGPDPKSSIPRSFKLRVDPKPAYALVDLGELQSRNITAASGVNDAGWVVGYAQTQNSDRRGILLRGLNDTTGFEDLGTLGANGSRSEAIGINTLNQVVGYTITSAGSSREATLWKDETLGSLRTVLNPLGDDSVAMALTDLGDITGHLRAGANRRGFRILTGSAPAALTPLGGFPNSEAYSLNLSGAAVGVSYSTGGNETATFWPANSATATTIGIPPGHFSSRATGINDSGLIIVSAASTADPASSRRRGFLYQNGSFTPLGTLTDGSNAEPFAINSFGQIVGTATKGGSDGAGVSVALLRTAGQNYDLNELIYDARTFKYDSGKHKLREARSISRNGTIVGVGNIDGRDHGFLALPAWVIGRPIAAPEGAVTRRPEIEILDGASDDNQNNAFSWNLAEKRLYAIRPVTARLKWFRSFEDLVGSGTNLTSNTDRIVTVGITVWPKVPTYHVAGSPVILDPAVPTPEFTFQGIEYSAPGSTPRVDPTSKTFNADTDGFTVLHYLKTSGGQPSPSTQSPYYEVVRTILWNNPAYLDERSALVGDVLKDLAVGSDVGHQDYGGRTGYVLQELAPYDGSGADRAYDRNTRQGDIIPVNRDTGATSDDLVVVWYRMSPIRVPWASRPARYRLEWPSDQAVSKIVIASEQGSGPLPPDTYASPRVYVQADPRLPGLNPNEEHALIVPSNKGSGLALFALRNDLNERLSPVISLPYALLKYRNPETGRWVMKVYKVLAEDDENTFRYTATAGTEIQPPYPLSLLQPLSAKSVGVSGPWWRDYKNRIYARAAGVEGGETNIVIRWFYPLQPDFYYDINQPAGADAAVGDAVAWLDRRTAKQLAVPNETAGAQGTPIDVTYAVSWPSAKVLRIGETLVRSKNDLPAVGDMAKVQPIYDDLNPTWDPLAENATAPINSLARLYDPLTPRVVFLTPGQTIPSTIKQATRSGKTVFLDLPQTLQSRFKFDPDLNALTFSGIYDADSFPAAEPILLPNVLSSRELDRLKALAPGDSKWSASVQELFRLTRNPNRVDLDGKPDGKPDGIPDTALRLGLINQYSYTYQAVVTDSGSLRTSTNTLSGATFDTNEIASLPAFRVVATNVVVEPLGGQLKALTAGLGGIPAGVPRPGNGLSFDGVDDQADLGSAIDLTSRPFTIEFWAKRTQFNRASTILSQDESVQPGAALRIGFQANERLAFSFGGRDMESTTQISDTNWHHFACVFDNVSAERRIYRDGVLELVETNAPSYSGSGVVRLGYSGILKTYFQGQIDELRIWNVAKSLFALNRDRVKRLTGDEDGLVRYFRFDEVSGTTIADAGTAAQDGTLIGGLNRVASQARAGIPPRYLTLVENNDPALGSLPVSLHIIRIEDGPFLGDLKVFLPDNAFDERLTLRHSNDFGADPDPIGFEWYYHPSDETYDPFNPALLPQVGANGAIANLNGWILYNSGQGVNDITLGESGESGIFAITDNYWIGRYRGYHVGINDTNTWSDWVGDPAGKTFPIPALGEGWVKRVIRSLNPFDQRSKDFHTASVNTYSSMIVQAGPRYEGPIALNPDAEKLDSVGLIEIYSTVLDVAGKKSINAARPINYNPANNALLLAASRISDLYVLLGNEAYADALDPTIGFGTASGEYGSLASSIFAFQNQLDSSIDEELALLRGRDTSGSGVQSRPVYNRLLWNFTLGEGEVAYQQTYNIFDQNKDGFVDERDAKVQYPQGHGDSWGHYLTAITTYYSLLQHPFFTWIPRAEAVTVGGQGVLVDFLDERKFARAASARAKAGRDIVNLTYRRFYVDDPAGQWQGYKDTDIGRGWGVSEWAGRAAQGAYFDWLTANAILPAVDPNPAHAGIQKIDRTTVTELSEIPAQAADVQGILDQADEGLNPLGLAKGAVPFDIDPTFLEVGSTAQIGRRAVQGLTQFDQILERAIAAMKNAVNVWDQANRATELLRQNQDSQNEFSNNLIDQENDYKNRLIEIFGYPYVGDIGPGRTYPNGYDGPDYFHYMYVDTTGVDTEGAPISSSFTGFFKPIQTEPGKFSYTFNADSSVADPSVLETEILPVLYPLSVGDYGFKAPTTWGARRAPGELQLALSDCVQANASLLDALQTYCGQVSDIQAAVALLDAQKQLNSSVINAKATQLGLVSAINVSIGVMNAVEANLRRVSSTIRDVNDGLKEALPKVIGLATDVSSLARGAISIATSASVLGMETIADNLGVAQNALNLSKEVIGLSTDLAIDVKTQDFEVLQRIKEIEHMMRDEYNLRIRCYQEAEVVRQNYGRYKAKLAEGARLIEERKVFRTRAAASTSRARYEDMTFRIFRNDAIQKYRASFDLAAKYVYLAANAYDFEVNFGSQDNRSAGRFLTDIVRQRSLGQMVDGNPAVGQPGLADSLARLEANWAVLKTQLGVVQPQIADTRFSVREELLRISGDAGDATANRSWQRALTQARVPDLWALPEFRRFCRPFAPESAGPQPAIVLRFPTKIEFGLNYFGWPLSGGDSAYDPSQYSTKIARAGVWLSGSDGTRVSQTPRVYLVPVGLDVLRVPTGSDLLTREFRLVDQLIPPPFPIGATDLKNPDWIPTADSLGGNFTQIRRYGSLSARHDAGIYAEQDLTNDTRLIGRSAWNTDWMLIIPGGTLLNDPDAGLEAFIDSVSDIKIYFQTYSYSGL